MCQVYVYVRDCMYECLDVFHVGIDVLYEGFVYMYV